MKKLNSGKPIVDRVRRRIKKMESGSIFLVRDFLDIGEQGTITRILARLNEEGTIHRIQRGVYTSPRISTLLGKPIPPTPAQIAVALARRTGGEIIPSPAEAANMLSLTTQVPAKNVFQTNSGKTRRFRVGNQIIELRRVSARHFPKSRSEIGSNDKTEAIIQGLRFVGEGNITAEIIDKVRGELNGRQKAALSETLGDTPAWMHLALRQISRKDEG